MEINDIVNNISKSALQFLTDTCIHCTESNVISNSGNTVKSFTQVTTYACLVRNNTKDTTNTDIADVDNTKEYKVFNLPKCAEVGINDFLLYKGVYYKVTKATRNSNSIYLVIDAYGVVK